MQCSTPITAATNRRFLDFIKEHPEFVVTDNAMGFFSHNGGETYNGCHCKFGHVCRCLGFENVACGYSLEQL